MSLTRAQARWNCAIKTKAHAKYAHCLAKIEKVIVEERQSGVTALSRVRGMYLTRAQVRWNCVIKTKTHAKYVPTPSRIEEVIVEND